MYHRIVGRMIRQNYAQLNQGNYTAIIQTFHPQMDHSFAGDHALSGTRHRSETIQAWYARLYRLFNGLHLQIQDTVIQGMPWNTKVVVRAAINVTLPDGQPYTNELVQMITLRWGKITRMSLHEDTQKLADTLRAMAAAGIQEAAAAPIAD
ncbi:MAG: nuclear transport factor 2 family protein [Anaerolineae bacterium]|nr:nuclear transport factor 2 family protein [Anaerolineae bacterium]